MTRLRRRLSTAVLGFLLMARPPGSTATPVQAESDRAVVRKELQDVEIENEKLKRFLPDVSASELEDAIRKRGAAAGLTRLEVTPVTTPGVVEEGLSSVVEWRRFDVSARQRYEEIHAFLDLLARARSSMFIGFETLVLQAEPDDTVALSLRVQIAVLSSVTATAAAPVPPARSRAEVESQMLAAERSALAKQRRIHRALVALAARLQPQTIAGSLAAFDRAGADHALALTRIRSAEEMVLEGVVLGAAARAGLAAALGQAGFQVTGQELSPLGMCQAFSTKVRLAPRPEPPEGIVVANGLFDARAISVCRPEPASLVGRVALRGAAARDGTSGLSLHLRDVDLADVFRILHDLTSESFVVDADVAGRTSVDVEGATLEETLAAMKSAGVVVGGGPLRRVARAGAGARPPDPATAKDGDAVSFQFRHAGLRGVLCVFTEISGLPILAPPDVEGRVVLFAKDVPWDGALELVVAAAGLAYRIDGARLLVDRPGVEKSRTEKAATNVCTAVGSRRGWEHHSRTVDQLERGDLALAGVARAGAAWKAYALGPGGTLWTLEAGQRLRDGRVQAVSETGFTFEGGDGGKAQVPLGK